MIILFTEVSRKLRFDGQPHQRAGRCQRDFAGLEAGRCGFHLRHAAARWRQQAVGHGRGHHHHRDAAFVAAVKHFALHEQGVIGRHQESGRGGGVDARRVLGPHNQNFVA